MSIYGVVFTNACVAFLTAPVRRLRYLLTIEDDLIDEGVLPPQGFGGVAGCVRFLYNAGGRSCAVFYRGAFLEALGCLGKYELQRRVAIPIARWVPLRMDHAVLATTFFHTTLTYFTVAPLQTALETVEVNTVTNFTAGKAEEGNRDTGKEGAAPGNEEAVKTELPTVRLRFTSAWATAKYLARHFPVLAMVRRLYLLDFVCRYVSSLANNAILGWLMRRAQRHYHGVEMTPLQHFLMYAGCPLLVSLAMSFLTYPLTTYPVAHFLRVSTYETHQSADGAADAAGEGADEYPSSERYDKHRDQNCSSSCHHQRARGAEVHTAASSKGSGAVTAAKEERIWWEEVFFRALHPEVWAYLRRSLYGPDSTALLLSGETSPVRSSPANVAREAATKRNSGEPRKGGKRGIRQVYRGFGLVVASTLLSSALMMAISQGMYYAFGDVH